VELSRGRVERDEELSKEPSSDKSLILQLKLENFLGVDVEAGSPANDPGERGLETPGERGLETPGERGLETPGERGRGAGPGERGRSAGLGERGLEGPGDRDLFGQGEPGLGRDLFGQGEPGLERNLEGPAGRGVGERDLEDSEEDQVLDVTGLHD